MDAATPHPRQPKIRATVQIALHLALIPAVPLALWHLAGDPVPAHLPKWTEIHTQYAGLLQQPDQATSLLLHAGADVLWIAWACYSIATLSALAWILTHRPNAGLPRLLAAITPTLALRALSLGALVAAPATTPIANASSIPTARTSSLDPTTHPMPSTAPSSEGQPPRNTVHRVTSGDNLWDLAEHYYGNPEAWPRIYHANEGVTQADGRALEEPDLIIPGWRLTIPGVSGPAANPQPAAGPAGTGPAATAAHGPTAAATAPAGHPAPARPHTATTPLHTPTTRPAPNPAPSARPHTTGYALPNDAGYIGITLLAAIAAAVAILRTRNRRRGRPPDTDIPDLAQHLAATHAAAQSAATYGYRPDEHPDQQPPPLTASIMATSVDTGDGVPFDAGQLNGPLTMTGPGACDAARGLAINILAAEGHTLRANPGLIAELLGTTDTLNEPDWMEPTEPGNTISINESPATIIHVTSPGETDTTTLDVNQDGTLRSATGPNASRYAGTRIHTLNEESGAALFATLKDARPTAAPSPSSGTEDRHTAARSDPPESTAPDEPTNPAEIARAHASTPLILRVLGEVDILTSTGQSERVGTEQAAAILTLLALNPDGIAARTLRALEWPGSTDERRARLTLATAINRVRQPLRKLLANEPIAEPCEPVLHDRARQTYRLNPNLITTDLAIARQLTQPVGAQSNHADDVETLTDAAALHRGPLAAFLNDTHRDWLTTVRFDTLNDAVALHLRIANVAAPHAAELAGSHTRAAVSLAPEDHDTVVAALRVCRQLDDAELARDLYGTYLRALRIVDEQPEPEATRLADPTSY